MNLYIYEQIVQLCGRIKPILNIMLFNYLFIIYVRYNITNDVIFSYDYFLQ